ncbi:uncharacterized protein LOC105426203 [Pogonomyrmex barbatus]|uniref:Uncharacterized protein LOC105426203 n=1 Tax=Pogonomyrmex barbatus TaxID=144034 RepID=A0A6I9WUQ9_9HYME|nr:uncharacterized protein LOC105426203 [Pogonomyrmex barbatus]
MDDEMLIECVRQHVELYDLSDKRYIDGAYKQRVWNEISQKLGYPAIMCKMRWNNIRDNYRKSLKKRVTRSGLTGQPRNMRYKYENQLTFLLPFIRERDPNHSGLIREGDEVSTAGDTAPLKRDDNCDMQARPVADFETTEDGTDRSHDEETPTIKNERPGREFPIESSAKLAIPELMTSDYSEESNDLRFQSASSVSHSVDAFLASIAPTLKSLSPYYLNVTKTKIFTIVQEAEMIQIVEQQKRYRARKRRGAVGSPDEPGTSPFSSPAHVPAVPSASPQSYDFSPHLFTEMCPSDQQHRSIAAADPAAGSKADY